MSNKRASFITSFGQGSGPSPVLLAGHLGQRGAALCNLARLKLPVPPGFVLNTEACRNIASSDPATVENIKAMLAQGLESITTETGCTLGDKRNLLLLAVRPSAPISFPGATEAVLNVGLNDETVEGLGVSAGDHAFAYECYRRLMQNYAQAVLGDDPAVFDDLLNLYVEERGYVSAREIRGTDGPELASRFKAQIESNNDRAFPQDVEEQLWHAVAALARNWQSPRAKQKRKLHGLKEDAGLAIVVQAMVFGNQSDHSGTGHATSRPAQTGEREVGGDYLTNAQGSDLDARLRQVLAIAGPAPSLETEEPGAFAQLASALDVLEHELKDAVEVDFTVAQGALWLLDARPARRTTSANLRILTDLVAREQITKHDALMRIDPVALDQLLHSTIDPAAKRELVAQGIGASPGAASGIISFDANEARVLAGQGIAVILVRTETAPEDIKGLHMADGVLTTRGGMTSHAAVIARGMGKPCVTGASSLRIDMEAGQLKAAGVTLKRGDIITIDGSSGQVLKGQVAVTKPSLSGDFATILTWADETRRMKVRANAETAHDARLARDFGAEGIGLSRTEHMFFEGDRIIAMREMILADTEKERRIALAKILPVLRADFIELFAIMAGMPVTIRLLDPPLHEFLPREVEEIEAMARNLNLEVAGFKKRVLELREQNPMLGHRGVRLLLSYPEITDMQARAIFEAAAHVQATTGTGPIAEVMVPLVASRGELSAVRARIDAVARDVAKETGQKLEYLVGTMIELPRAALRAADIAEAAEFFSFGTNDLTQTTYGISRDDSARFIGEYTNRQIFPHDPFVSLDVEGVGELIAMAVERGRQGRPGLHLGICGEHGGNPDSISFFEAVGLDYVSCSPFRVPVARLAAAQAHLKLARKS
ncbi:pyruvate, phosphate dikinase [Aestuariivirga litoralis]|uniref:pyruvate, phosphate dikinase n=1 Tax=Aestuariivirga litoralis TaxID=2650924 RepID=UPI0018C67E35|nr:pyruvate, phosphate dikinase [Aestuariivirga litoralis]MBG1230840.1 pyruvate, phosphate dikinase [Aestuariivirga litoralis]